MTRILFFWMRYMKKLHKLILSSWIGPLLVAFSVILFILVLQFLSKYLDDLFGKGFETIVLVKVFVYSCITLVTMALPLAVLLSSLLTMGNMGERYELAAIKSSGIGLFRIMRPLTNGTAVITIAALLFSFYVVPIANLKLFTMLYDLSKVKPSFALKEGHFYSDIDGMVIHVGGIDRQKDVLYKIKIFDHTDKVGNNRITLADSGVMVPAGGTGYLQMTLFEGVIHEEIPKKPGSGTPDDQYHRFYFDTLDYQVGMAGFNLEESESNTFAPHQYMKDIHALYHSTDSMAKRLDGYQEDLDQYILKYTHVDTSLTPGERHNLAFDTTHFEPDGVIEADLAKPVFEWFPEVESEELINRTTQHCRAVKNYTTIIQERLDRENLKIRKFDMEIHNRYALPISCLVFLFLGAPLGAIIRKGGVGMPVIISIGFFIVFYILMIQGRKFARDEILPVWVGIWLPVLLMAPMAIFFTWTSARDSAILYSSGWWKAWKFLFGWIRFGKKKEEQPHTMSIQDLIDKREAMKEAARKKVEEYKQDKEESG